MRGLLIVSVVALLALSGAAWLMGSPVLRGLAGRVAGEDAGVPARTEGPRTEAMVRLVGSSVREVELERSGRHETLRETPQGWMLTIEDGGSTGASWPVDADRVRALLRLLADTRGEVSSAGEALAGATLRLRGEGAEIEITLPRDALAGTALVRVRTGGSGSSGADASASGDRWLRIPDDLQRALVGTGFEAWRTGQAFALLSLARPARIEMARADSRLSLARLGDRWTIREPVSASADTPAVDALVRTLASVRVREFVPGQADLGAIASEQGAHAVIRVESDRREEINGEVARLVLAQEVAILGTGGVSGETVRAIAQITETNTRSGETRIVAGPVHVLLEGAALTGLRFDPGPLASKRSLQRPAGDVVRVTVTRGDASLAYERWSRGWSRAGEEEPVDAGVARAIDACLAMIADADADASEVKAGPVTNSRARIDLDLLGGERVSLELGAPSGTAKALELGDGAFTRTYTEGAAARIEAFDAILPREE
ncbi:MAG: hypothetical protein RBS39_10940 [Phycisphaerales bacterium]|jgi:hypothetical protein|nr:hypothetical protein [Phycisphaerales bacterium]